MLLLSALVSLALAASPEQNCPKNLLSQAAEAFPDHACHLGIQEPGGFAIFCNQRLDGSLTDTEIPIFIGVDPYRFTEVPAEARSLVWAFVAQKFMHLSNEDFVEVTDEHVICEGPNIMWWAVETHPPLDEVSRRTSSGSSRRL